MFVFHKRQQISVQLQETYVWFFVNFCDKFSSNPRKICVFIRERRLSSLCAALENRLPEGAAECENITHRQIRGAAFSSRQFSSRSKFDGNEIQTLLGSQMFNLTSPKLRRSSQTNMAPFPLVADEGF